MLRAHRRATVAAGTVLALVIAALVLVVVRGRDDAGSLVTRTGTQFQLDGKPFRFVGFNLFDAASTPAYTCASWPRYTDAELDAAFGYMHDRAGATVVRFWAYQPYTQGGTDFGGVDRVLEAARAHHMRVLPVLEDGPGYCTTGPSGQAKYAVGNGTWYLSGYRRPYGTAKLSFRDYARVVTTRYRGNPTILGWSMMNEAETSRRGARGQSGLLDFARDMAQVIKAADPTHLLTVGTQSNSAPGASGTDFAQVYGISQVDFTEVHDWASRGSDTEPIPGVAGDGGLPSPNSPGCQAITAPVACSFAIAGRVLDKPMVVGEAGIAANTDAERARRADLLGAKMDAAFAHGVAGYLVWQFNKVVDTEHFDVLDTGDPLIPRMSGIARTLAETPAPSASEAPSASPAPSASRPNPSVS